MQIGIVNSPISPAIGDDVKAKKEILTSTTGSSNTGANSKTTTESVTISPEALKLLENESAQPLTGGGVEPPTVQAYTGGGVEPPKKLDTGGGVEPPTK